MVFYPARVAAKVTVTKIAPCEITTEVPPRLGQLPKKTQSVPFSFSLSHQSGHDGRVQADNPDQLGPRRLQRPVVQPLVVGGGEQPPPAPRPAERRDGARVGLDHSADPPATQTCTSEFRLFAAAVAQNRNNKIGGGFVRHLKFDLPVSAGPSVHGPKSRRQRWAQHPK